MQFGFKIKISPDEALSKGFTALFLLEDKLSSRQGGLKVREFLMVDRTKEKNSKKKLEKCFITNNQKKLKHIQRDNSVKTMQPLSNQKKIHSSYYTVQHLFLHSTSVSFHLVLTYLELGFESSLTM